MSKRYYPLPQAWLYSNVRELQNVIEHAMILSANGILWPQVPARSPGARSAAPVAPRLETLDDTMRAHILDVLRATKNAGCGGSAGGHVMHELSHYLFEPLWAEGEFVLSRSAREAALAPLLIMAPVLAQPAPESLQRLAHAYALREELEPVWAVCPLALVRHQGRLTLVLTDQVGEVLARLIGQPWEVTPFLRVAIGVVARGTPELVLVSSAAGIGKSAVVHDLHKALVPPRYYAHLRQ
jgi:hypothetical protein